MPRNPYKAVLRKSSVVVYLTQEEQDFITSEAERYGTSRSDIVRACIKVIWQMRNNKEIEYDVTKS